jgi:hypothetical protein
VGGWGVEGEGEAKEDFGRRWGGGCMEDFNHKQFLQGIYSLIEFEL